MKETAVTTRARKRKNSRLLARVISVFLALLLVAGSLAALVELL